MDKKKLIARIAALLLVFILLASIIAPLVYATEGDNSSSEGGSSSSKPSAEEIQSNIEKFRNEKKAIEQKIKAYEKDIKNNKNAAAAAAAKRQEYQNLADLLEQEIIAKLAEIEQKELDIERKAIEINEKQSEFDAKEENLRGLLSGIYKMNTTDPLSVLLSVSSFSEFLIVYDNLQRVSVSYTDKLNELETQRKELEDLKLSFEGDKIALEADRDDMNATLEEHKKIIKEQEAKESEALKNIRQSEEEKAKAYEQMQSAEAALEEQIKLLKSSYAQYLGGELHWPVQGYNGDRYISSHYGNRTLYGRPSFHRGMDINKGDQSSITGASILAANDGKVVLVDTSNPHSGYGYYLVIDHGGGVKTVYAHCNSISVSVNDTVSRGLPIGTVGNTGNSTGPHLHFELRVNGSQYIDPYPYLTGSASLG